MESIENTREEQRIWREKERLSIVKELLNESNKDEKARKRAAEKTAKVEKKKKLQQKGK